MENGYGERGQWRTIGIHLIHGNTEGKGVVFKDEVMQGKVFASNQCAKAQGFDANPRLGFGSKSQSMQHILKRLPQKGQTQ